MTEVSFLSKAADWCRRMFRWDRSPSVPPSSCIDEGEVTGVYNRTLLQLTESTDAMRSRRRRSLADAERRVQDGIDAAEQVFDDVLGKRPP